jgi:hypothetical protein
VRKLRGKKTKYTVVEDEHGFENSLLSTLQPGWNYEIILFYAVACKALGWG